MNRNLVSVLTFSLSVLLLTRLDYLVNNILYGFGLSFSKDWYNEYVILYSLAYQLVIFVLFAYTKNLKLLALFECFVLTCTQDLIYFGLWEMSFSSGNWDWIIFNDLLGFWNTQSQILLSVSSLTLISLLCRVERLRTGLNNFSGQTPMRKLSRFLIRLFDKKGVSLTMKASKKWKNRVRSVASRNWNLRCMR